MRSILLVQVSRCEAFCLQHIRWWVVDSLVSTADPVPVIYVTYKSSIGHIIKDCGLREESENNLELTVYCFPSPSGC
jgi:hypothetical protein